MLASFSYFLDDPAVSTSPCLLDPLARPADVLRQVSKKVEEILHLRVWLKECLNFNKKAQSYI